MFVDTHTHLFTEAFDEDREAVVNRALVAGVQKMLLPNIDVSSIPLVKKMAEQYPENCLPMMGLHPGSVGANWKADLEEISKELFSGKYLAVGEIGMDLYWDKTYVLEQGISFRKQVEWAKELNLPIAIHAREAFDEIFAILDELNDNRLKGVFHCFTGNVEQVKKVKSYGGFYFGIGGVLTYKKSGLDEVVKDIPLNQIILETDSPYLPPTPHRGKRNESSYLLHVAEKLADVKGISLLEVERVTTENAIKLFNL